jgi:hypothetical protein
MGRQGSLKASRRAIRKTAQEEKNNIVSQYMIRNWDKIVVSSVAVIRQFDFKNRFKIAMIILFRPLKKNQPKADSPAQPAAIPKNLKIQASGVTI